MADGATVYLDDRPNPQPLPVPHDWEKRPYNPFPGLRPRALSFQYGPGAYGQTLTISTVGSDPIGRHFVSGVLALDGAHATPQASLTYGYGRLPFDYGITAFRYLGPRKGSYSINGQEPAYDEVFYGIVNQLSYAKVRPFDYFSWGVSYTGAFVGAELPVGRNLDPYATIGRDPSVRGFLGIARAGRRNSRRSSSPTGANHASQSGNDQRYEGAGDSRRATHHCPSGRQDRAL